MLCTAVILVGRPPQGVIRRHSQVLKGCRLSPRSRHSRRPRANGNWPPRVYTLIRLRSDRDTQVATAPRPKAVLSVNVPFIPRPVFDSSHCMKRRARNIDLRTRMFWSPRVLSLGVFAILTGTGVVMASTAQQEAADRKRCEWAQVRCGSKTDSSRRPALGPLRVICRHSASLNGCPLYPRRRTSGLSGHMSATGHQQTSPLRLMRQRGTAWAPPRSRHSLPI